ncbi:hypothetical protein BV20DRAFT_1018500 [Pilatotrama ljubarskyi]|nr:hypothetical protein BV20DRAFT_1018500 [Pilatotrama ljubarskyi]
MFTDDMNHAVPGSTSTSGRHSSRPRLRKLPSRVLSGLFGAHFKKRVGAMLRGATDGKCEENGNSAHVLLHLHINNLPDELIVEIFDAAHAVTFSSIDGRTLTNWLHLFHVCARWRYIIASVPSFWRVIPIVRSLKALYYFDQFRRNTPLEIHFADLHAIPSPVKALRPYLPEIRLLSLSMHCLDFQNSPLDDVFSVPMPALEELHIMPQAVLNTEARTNAPLSLLHFRTIRHLKLYRLICPSDFGGWWLESLHLHACVWNISFDSFITTLRRCWSLVKLRLDQSLHPLALTAPQGRVSYPHLGRASLYDLRSLIIEDYSPELVSTVLAHVRAPFIRYLRVVCYATRPRREDSEALVSSEGLLRPLLPPDPWDHLQLALDAGSATANISIRDDMCTLTVSSVKAGYSSTATLSARFDRQWTRVVPTAMQDLTDLFSSARITTLVIHGSSYYIFPMDWMKLFNALPSLETLDLTSSGTWVAMWHGLRRAGRLQSAPEDVGCPRLATIRIRHISRPEDNYPAPPDEDDLKVIKDTLRWRATHGVRLRNLSWSMCSAEHADYDAARKRFLDELRPFIEGALAYEYISDSPAPGVAS